MSDDETEPLVAVFVPSLASLLIAEHDRLGRALDEDEVSAVRDAARITTMPLGLAIAQAKARGYRDIDPDRAYAEYLELRSVLRPDGAAPSL
ncbi:MAG: hypothetical protein H0X45_01755 [Planctomycetes bacterium]|nr:hypothetical protein [Planctomycetota bacterium]